MCVQKLIKVYSRLVKCVPPWQQSGVTPSQTLSGKPETRLMRYKFVV